MIFLLIKPFYLVQKKKSLGGSSEAVRGANAEGSTTTAGDFPVGSDVITIPSTAPIVNKPADGEEGEQSGEEDRIQNYLSGFQDVVEDYVLQSSRFAEFNFQVSNFNFDTLKRILAIVFRELEGRAVVLSIQTGYLL